MKADQCELRDEISLAIEIKPKLALELLLVFIAPEPIQQHHCRTGRSDQNYVPTIGFEKLFAGLKGAVLFKVLVPNDEGVQTAQSGQEEWPPDEDICDEKEGDDDPPES